MLGVGAGVLVLLCGAHGETGRHQRCADVRGYRRCRGDVGKRGFAIAHGVATGAISWTYCAISVCSSRNCHHGSRWPLDEVVLPLLSAMFVQDLQ